MTQHDRDHYLAHADVNTIFDLIVAEFRSDPTSTQCFDLRIVKRAIELAAKPPGRVLPATCPPALVWRPAGPRIWTGAGWMDAGTDARAEQICAAHNGVLSGLFGSDAMP